MQGPNYGWVERQLLFVAFFQLLSPARQREQANETANEYGQEVLLVQSQFQAENLYKL